MYGGGNDKVTETDLVINFHHKNLAEEDREKKWNDWILLPTVELATVESVAPNSFDIHHFHNETGNHHAFSRLTVDADKLKQYIVPYIDMTHEFRVGIKRKYQRKIRF